MQYQTTRMLRASTQLRPTPKWSAAAAALADESSAGMNCLLRVTIPDEIAERLAAEAAGRKPRIHDTWIAATALVHGAEVWTQDADFSDFADTVTIVRV